MSGHVDSAVAQDLPSGSLDVENSGAIPMTADESDNEDPDLLYVSYVAGDPHKRDPTWLPLVMSKDQDKCEAVVSKIDTGASANFITLELVEKLRQRLGLELPLEKISDLQNRRHDEIDDKGEPFRTWDNHTFYINNIVRIDVWIGIYLKHFNIEFEVLENPADTDVPHILLGARWVWDNSILTFDPHYAMDPKVALHYVEPEPDEYKQICFFDHKPKDRPVPTSKTVLNQPSHRYR